MATPLFLSFLSVSVAVGSAEEQPWWLEPQVADFNEVNEGRLEFLPRAPDHPVHHHDHAIRISRSTLRDGWAHLAQCHQHLDPVGRAEIVFREGRVCNLAIDHQMGIGKAWISGHSVELRDVDRSSRLCLSAETKVMETDGSERYVLRNGPFMRRFLDGYYPMRLTMRVQYPCGALEISDIQPQPQAGFHVSYSPCAVTIEALFQGRLNTQIRFRSSSVPTKPLQVEP